MFRNIAQALDPSVLFGDVVGHEADPWQKAFLRSRARQVLLLCCRQAGKSTSTAVLALHTALFQPRSLTLLFGPTQAQSRELFLKLASFSREAVDLEPEAESAQRIVFPNGSRVVCLSGNPSSARGYSAPALIVVDEAAFVEDELIFALLPMMAGGGRLILLSTPFAQSGHFYRTWSDGAPTWERHLVTAFESPRFTRDFIEQQRQDLPPHRFASEFLCEFGANDTGMFPSDLVRAALTSEIHPLFPSVAA